MGSRTRLSFLCLLIAGALFVSQQQVRASNFDPVCGEGYHLSGEAHGNCYPNDPFFCWDYDTICMWECSGSPWPDPWFGIYFDWSNPCDYYCCCKNPTS